MNGECRKCGHLIGEKYEFFQLQLVQYDNEVYYTTSENLHEGIGKVSSPVQAVRSTGTISLCETCTNKYLDEFYVYLEYVRAFDE